MVESTQIKSALVSVYSKEGLEPIIRQLHALGIKLYSTGGTQAFIEDLGIPVTPVEALTGMPSILEGRVKTLHPSIFGGILARREPAHLDQLKQYSISLIDCLIVDLYPFEHTVAHSNLESEIIEKIDIGGISLIRAAAKNYRDVVVIGSSDLYDQFLSMLQANSGFFNDSERREFARLAFKTTSNYDTAIYNWFHEGNADVAFKQSIHRYELLRYGENPHQSGVFFGDLTQSFDKIGGKSISYNNLIDIDSAIQLMREFQSGKPTFAILKHTNACGVAERDTLLGAWDSAYECDKTSAFGGILITNARIDRETATAINKVFYEVLMAPDFDADALSILQKKEQRILLKIRSLKVSPRTFRSLLHGVVEQEVDKATETETDLRLVTRRAPTPAEVGELLFAVKCVKHLKSNAIALIQNKQLVGMGCGQPSRVDALRQAIAKAHAFGFDLTGSVMASDAFFPFPDCVEIAHEHGITAVVQPGGSVKDQDCIDACDDRGMAMVFTGFRHFKH